MISKPRKLFLKLFLMMFVFWRDTHCQLNMYETDQSDVLQYDCLNYYVYREKQAYQELLDVVDESISYCFRPENNFKQSPEISIGPHSTKLSFEQIRISGITALQLFSWSTPIETIERYQFYFNAPNSAFNEQFYNCTQPWFGVSCQYSFGLHETMSFNAIVDQQFLERTTYTKVSGAIVSVPCYVLLECHRHGKDWCLDWREICDGKIDCFDEGLDEENCFYMEINQCNEDEYRCHNGLCISEDLWEDGLGETECLDRSDSDANFSFIDSCYRDPSFRCEEHSCRANDKSFSCGDGQCVYHFEQCQNGRHELLIDSFTARGSLNDDCWNAMVCLSGFDKKCNESLYELWSNSDKTILRALEQCDVLFDFPTIPIQSNHIYFSYENVSLKPYLEPFLAPDYVCYDEQLCDSITPTFIHENRTCVSASLMLPRRPLERNPWVVLMLSVERYFRSCKVFAKVNQSQINPINNPSLYKCEGSSKFISVNRIMDGYPDCFQEDDENHKYNTSIRISFEMFCDGIEHYFYDDDDEQEHSDEFGCGDWSCNNMYTRCDGYWTCPNGRDEDRCDQQICPPQRYACISPYNFSVSCLSSEFINNNSVAHCLGKMNQQSRCHAAQYSKEISYPFSCSHSVKCLSLSQLCDGLNDCINDDDEVFCKNQPLTCDRNSTHNYTDAEKVICELRKIEKHRIKHFSVHTSSNQPSAGKFAVGEFNHAPKQPRLNHNHVTVQEKNNSMPWRCHRGVIIRTWTTDNTTNQSCICPPSYYGTTCQYHSQRVSISLKISSNARSVTYAIVIMLVDDTNEQQQQIEAYDQFIYVVKESCSVKLGRYLLFTTRSKDKSKNYSIRFDVFEKNTLSYTGSWHHSIKFLFLPVNRFGISLNLSSHLLVSSIDCPTPCNNGQCTKYVNKNATFCRCSPGWTGLQCNTSLSPNGRQCSSDSLHIASTKNRSICVCPIGKFGRQCLFTSTCPSTACQNNGQCVPADLSILGNNFTCLCPVQFFGPFCQYRKAKLDVSFVGIPAPLYLVAHFFTLSNKSDPIETIILRKLTLFQLSVSFHIAVPFQLVFVQADQHFYLTALQQTPKSYISASITPADRCESTERLLNSTVLAMIPYRRILYFHLLCQNHFQLKCFIDKAYLCLCTHDHHANCLPFDSDRQFQCPSNNLCKNQGQCLQDHRVCPSTKICLCPDCFFGNRCEYYAKGMGTNLDEIIGYRIKSNTKLSEQPFAVKLTAVVITTLFVFGLINGAICLFVFSRRASREVGCGVYLLGSSINSLIIVVLYTLKFWLLFASHQNLDGKKFVLKLNCYGVEPFLQVFLQYDKWLNAFVALERATASLKGVKFNKTRSRRIAILVTPISLIVSECLLIPPLTRLFLFYDETEERTWCVVKYVEWLQIYRTAFIYIYYFVPFLINVVSMALIITVTAHQKHRSHKKETYMFYVRSQMKKNNHILISAIAVTVLTLPHLIISFLLGCKKSTRVFWLSLIAYLLSLLPATLIFFIFALPSPLYKKQFKKLIKLFEKYRRIRRAN